MTDTRLPSSPSLVGGELTVYASFGSFSLPPNVRVFHSLHSLPGWLSNSSRVHISLRTAGIETVQDLLAIGGDKSCAREPLWPRLVDHIPGFTGDAADELISYLRSVGFDGALEH